MAFRKLLFWLHLILGSAAGLVILMMCVTGVILTYEQQIISWVDRGYRVDPVPGASRLQLESLVSLVPAARAVAVKRDPAAPVEVTAAGKPLLMVHPYTGEVMGEANQGVRKFFRSVTEWHRWFAAKPEGRAFPRAITGAANLMFGCLLLSGLYLWMPRQWTWRHVQPVLWFRGRLTGRARDFNWHNVIGLWCALPLFFIIVSGAVMSYPWANNLVYTLTGTKAPAPAKPSSGVPPASHAPVPMDGLNAAWTLAEPAAAGWQMMALKLPESPKAPFVFTFDGEARRGRPDKRVIVTVDRTNAGSLRVEDFSAYNAGRQTRTWLRWLHTGEALGIAGQTIAGLASAGGAVLVWTGLALALRRFRAWRDRSGRLSKAAPEPVEEETPVA